MINRIHIVPDYKDIDATLKLCDRYGLCFEYNDFFVPSLLDDEEELRSRIDFYRRLGRGKCGDSLHGAFLDICVNSSDAKIAGISRERMYQSMEIASELECSRVIFHSNLISGFESEDYQSMWLDAYTEFYGELLGRYDGIEIVVENMFDNSPKMLKRLAQNMAGEKNFGICYDVAHTNVWSGNITEWIDELAGSMRHLHINDNDGTTDSHSAVGTGTIDWKAYFEKINSLDLSQELLIEVGSKERFVESMDYLVSNKLINIELKG